MKNIVPKNQACYFSKREGVAKLLAPLDAPEVMLAIKGKTHIRILGVKTEIFSALQ